MNDVSSCPDVSHVTLGNGPKRAGAAAHETRRVIYRYLESSLNDTWEEHEALLGSAGATDQESNAPAGQRGRSSVRAAAATAATMP